MEKYTSINFTFQKCFGKKIKYWQSKLRSIVLIININLFIKFAITK